MVTFVLVDTSDGAKTADGEALSPEARARTVAAVELQLNRDFAPHWGGTYRMRVAGGPADVLPGECPYVIRPTIAAANAIADHYANPDGSPAAEDAITLSDSLFGPGNSSSAACGHECLEVGADGACNIWRDGGDGYEYAQEVSDPVEAQTYAVTLDDGTVIYVPNFVLPAYFTPGAPGPYDYLSSIGPNPLAPTGPFQVAPGGNYQIVRSAAPGGGTIIQARYSGPDLSVSLTIPFAHTRADRRLIKRRHPSSRTYRRGLRL